jgi:hypothetical protein
MGALGNSLLQMLALLAFGIGFLVPLRVFLGFRRRRARTHGRAYVAQADPWVPLVVALTGVLILAVCARLR